TAPHVPNSLSTTLHERPATRTRSQGDHALAVHRGKPRDQAVGVVVAADPGEVVQTALPDVSAGERLEPHAAVDRPDEIPIEVSPARLSPPALFLAESEMDV